jgi:hypothetical protein
MEANASKREKVCIGNLILSETGNRIWKLHETVEKHKKYSFEKGKR